MHKFALAAVLGAMVIAAAPAAEAFPAFASTRAPSADVVQVRNGCGIGWHRGPYGYCRRNGVPYAVYPPPPVRCWWIDTAYGPRRVCAW